MKCWRDTGGKSKVDVAIIGAGISGLSAARCLRLLRPSDSMAIFERGEVAGGRLLSVPCPELEEGADLGAGRFDPARHPHVARLMHEMSVVCVPACFHLCPVQAGFEAVSVEVMRDSCTRLVERARRMGTGELHAIGFREFSAQVLGQARADFLIMASGYDLLHDPRLCVAQGLALLEGHPEFIGITQSEPGRWMRPRQGFQRLAQSLAEELELSCAFHYEHALQGIEQISDFQGAEAVRMTFLAGGERRVIDSRYLIFAAPLHDFSLLAGGEVSPTILDNIISVPLTKACFFFSEPLGDWGEEGSRCLTTHEVVRKIYINREARHITAYADGPSAIRLMQWLQGLPADGIVPISALKEILRFVSSVKLPGGEVRCHWKHWERGVAFWNSGMRLLPQPYWSPSKRVLVCNDLCTDDPGWIEGAITSAEAAGYALADRLSSEGLPELAAMAGGSDDQE